MTDATTRKSPTRDGLPGQRGEDRLAEMLRVDHAGEYGAVRIYEGQLAVFKHLPHKARMTRLLTDMAKGEEAHLARFDELLATRRVRPTAMAPIWEAAGFALGAATALMGEKAAMACTAAVEEVIDEHYGAQAEALAQLGDDETDLRQTIEQFRAEEIEHKETALAEGAEQAPGYELLSGAIKAACRFAIKVSEKV